MPDSPTWLSVEQREAMNCFSIRRSWDLLYASHAEADRREAELREQPQVVRCQNCGGTCVFKRDGIELVVTHSCWTKEQREQLAAKDAEIARERHVRETAERESQQHGQRTGDLYVENERMRAALKAADRELINAVCDGAYYKPDETRMKIFRDGLREALAATPPAKEGK